MLAEGPQRPAASYCFAQQTDNSCHVLPFINLSILNQLREKALAEHEDIDLAKHAKWYNKRHWLPQTFQWTKTWQQAMARASGTEFGQYQQEMFANGVLSGHVYDEAGNN